MCTNLLPRLQIRGGKFCQALQEKTDEIPLELLYFKTKSPAAFTLKATGQVSLYAVLFPALTCIPGTHCMNMDVTTFWEITTAKEGITIVADSQIDILWRSDIVYDCRGGERFGLERSPLYGAGCHPSKPEI